MEGVLGPWEGSLMPPGSQHSCVWLTLLSGPDCSCPIAGHQQETTVPFLGPLGHTETTSFQPESEWCSGEERDEKGEMARWKRRMTGRADHFPSVPGALPASIAEVYQRP